jgi:hypothetical protein
MYDEYGGGALVVALDPDIFRLLEAVEELLLTRPLNAANLPKLARVSDKYVDSLQEARNLVVSNGRRANSGIYDLVVCDG